MHEIVRTCVYHQQHECRSPFSLSVQPLLGHIPSVGTLSGVDVVRATRTRMEKLKSKTVLPTADFDRMTDIDSLQGDIPLV